MTSSNRSAFSCRVRMLCMALLALSNIVSLPLVAEAQRTPSPAPVVPHTAAPTVASSEVSTAAPTASSTGIFATPAPTEAAPTGDLGATWYLTVSLSGDNVDNGDCSLFEVKTCRSGTYYERGSANGCQKLTDSSAGAMLTVGQNFTTDFGYVPGSYGVTDIMFYISTTSTGTIGNGQYTIVKLSFATDATDGSLSAVHTYASEDGGFNSVMDNFYYVDSATGGSVGKMDLVIYCGLPSGVVTTPAPSPGSTAAPTQAGTASPTASIV